MTAAAPAAEASAEAPRVRVIFAALLLVLLLAALGRLRERTSTTVADLARELAVLVDRIAALVGALELRGLVSDGAGPVDLTENGREAFGKLVDAGRAELTALLEHWERPEGEELAPVLRRLADSLVAAIPEDVAAPRR
jgi:DNA-binding MarR family transcriptional regulator